MVARSPSASGVPPPWITSWFPESGVLSPNPSSERFQGSNREHLPPRFASTTLPCCNKMHRRFPTPWRSRAHAQALRNVESASTPRELLDTVCMPHPHASTPYYHNPPLGFVEFHGHGGVTMPKCPQIPIMAVPCPYWGGAP